MAMLHVFLVDTGLMIKLDMEYAAASVSTLMEHINEKIFIPPNRQVLISSHGEPLAAEKRVASYPSAGTENQPIFLFSKASIQSAIPPSPSINLGSERSLKEEIDRCVNMKPSYETLVARAKLAVDFQSYAVDLGKDCENLVNDQNYQSQGWTAAVVNLEHITGAFEQQLFSFEDYYKSFLRALEHYKTLQKSFEKVFDWLNRLPLLPCLKDGSPEATLLDWISSHDQQSSLDNLQRQCHESVSEFKFATFEQMIAESRSIVEGAHNANMKEIRGLPDRLVNLHHRLTIAQRIVQDQNDMTQGFQQNQLRLENLGDTSVLPDLCSSHQKQLHVLMKNHRRLRDIRNVCARAKDELSVNLHTRLKWVMSTERQICNCNSKLVVYHHYLKKIKKRLEIFEQVCETPRLYVLGAVEVVRRRNYSKQFTEWSKSVSDSSQITRSEEMKKREVFHHVFRRHFVHNLFPGLDDSPRPFAESPPVDCDSKLPPIVVEDIHLLQRSVPEVMSHLHIDDPMVTSTQVRQCLSQSRLTQLAQEIPEVFFDDNKGDKASPQLTMSVLKKEISEEVEELPQSIQFQVGSVGTDDENSDFEPVSLGSLREGAGGNQSDSSDMLFESAELDFSDAPVSPAKSSGGSAKSSSSPIQIRSPKKGGLSPTSPLTSPLLSPTNFKSSTTSSMSLSDAIKSSQVVETISDSADIVKTARQEVLSLKTGLKDAQADFLNIRQTTTTEITNMKQALVNMLHASIAAQSCEGCAKLQRHVDTLNEINADQAQQLSKLHATVDDKNELVEQLRATNAEKDDKLSEIDSLIELDVEKRVELEARLTESRRYVTELEGELCDINTKLAALNIELEASKNENVQLRKSVADCEKLKSENNNKVLKLEEELENFKLENSSLVNDLKKLNGELKCQKDLREKLSTEMTNNRDNSKEEIETLTTKNNELTLTHKREIDNLQTNFADKIKDLEIKHDNELKIKIDEIKTENKLNIENLSNKETEMNKLIELHSSKIADTKNKHTIEINKLDERHTSEMEKLKLQSAETNSKHLEYVELLKKENNETKQTLEETKQILADTMNNLSETTLKLEETLLQCDETKANLSEKCSKLDDTVKTLDENLNSAQQTNETNLDHIGLLNGQIKEFKKHLSEKHFECSQTRDSMEAKHQISFNQVINKIKREKDSLITEEKSKHQQLEKTITSLKLKVETLNQEINTHKDGFTLFEMDSKKEKLALQNTIEDYKNTIEHLQKENQGLVASEDTLRKCNFDLEQANSEISTKLDAENSRLTEAVEQANREKLHVMQELKTHYDEALQKEICKEKVRVREDLEGTEQTVSSHTEKQGLSDSLLRTSSSLEEGIDELELHTLREKIKKLECENEELLKNTPLSTFLEKLWTEKISWKRVLEGGLSVIVYDETIRQYVVLTTANQKYFVHHDSLKEILPASPRECIRQWMLVVIKENERCMTKKANNKFNLPEKEIFYRCHVTPYEVSK